MAHKTSSGNLYDGGPKQRIHTQVLSQEPSTLTTMRTASKLRGSKIHQLNVGTRLTCHKSTQRVPNEFHEMTQRSSELKQGLKEAGGDPVMNPGKITYSFNHTSKQTLKLDIEKPGLGGMRLKADVPGLINTIQSTNYKLSGPAVVQSCPLLTAHFRRRRMTEDCWKGHLALNAAYKSIQSRQENGQQQDRKSFLTSLLYVKRKPPGHKPHRIFPHELSRMSLGFAVNRKRDQQVSLYYSQEWVSNQRGKLVVRATLEPKGRTAGIHVGWQKNLKCGIRPTFYIQAYPFSHKCYMGIQFNVWKRGTLLDFLTPGSVGKALGKSEVINFV